MGIVHLGAGMKKYEEAVYSFEQHRCWAFFPSTKKQNALLGNVELPGRI